jgi:hypothetical protein
METKNKKLELYLGPGRQCHLHFDLLYNNEIIFLNYAAI